MPVRTCPVSQSRWPSSASARTASLKHGGSVFEQRLEQEPVGRFQGDQADTVTPVVPFLPNFSELFRVNAYMHSGNIVREGVGITQGGQGAAMDPADWQDHPVAGIRGSWPKSSRDNRFARFL